MAMSPAEFAAKLREFANALEALGWAVTDASDLPAALELMGSMATWASELFEMAANLPDDARSICQEARQLLFDVRRELDVPSTFGWDATISRAYDAGGVDYDLHPVADKLAVLLPAPSYDSSDDGNSSEPRKQTPLLESGVGAANAEVLGNQLKAKKPQHRKNSEELFKSALRQHHKYDSDGSVQNYQPISTRQIEELTEKALSDTTAGRLMRKHFGGIVQYRKACDSKAIREKLIVLCGDGLHAFGTFDPTKSVLTDNAEDDSNE